MDNVWWNKVTNASRFLSMIVENIKEGQSVILKLPQSVPWYMTMQDMVSSDIIRAYSDRSLKYITDMGEDPGEFLFHEFCKKEKRARYRPGIGYPDFLAQSDDITLNQCILWINGADKEQVTKWYDFIDFYNKSLGKKKHGCLFVIESREEQQLQERRGIRIVEYENVIEFYDNYLFNMLASSQIKGDVLYKQYLAETVSIIIPDDVELSSKCIENGRRFLTSPLALINEIVEQEYRSDGSEFVFNTTEKQLEERLWEAQIKVVFPLLEKHRNRLVVKYKPYIEPLLPIKAAYGEDLKEASDVELGTMAYLISSGQISVDREDDKKITILKNARNVLAHIGVLTQEEVDEILSLK